jgi:hypothetical protein
MVFHKVEADDWPVIDGDMTADDICEVLGRLYFRRSDLQVIQVDRHARDFLVAAVRDRQGKG